jgi:DNA invertase Pin-like site-specific DNA recombinase/RNase P subunit RPR2
MATTLLDCRKTYKKSMISSALPDPIILFLYGLCNTFILSYFVPLIAIFPSYFLFEGLIGAASFLSYPQLLSSLFFPILCCASHTKGNNGDDGQNKSYLHDRVEDLGGDGPKVAIYLRVSTGRQAKKGYSLDSQYEQLVKLRDELKPSVIYWFVDAGKSGIDFDKRKINQILKLREKNKIRELWVTYIDRIGRECRKLIYFFLQFCDDGGVIRTPEKEYNLKDLSSLLVLVIEAYESEQTNRSRAKRAVDGKRQAFMQRRWNKPIPLGYRKALAWLQKIPEWEQLIKEVFYAFLIKRNLESVATQINGKYKQFLSKPLTRNQIRRVLSDPVYIGKPQNLGGVVVDHSLASVDEETYQKSLTSLEIIRQRYRPNRISPIDKLATSDPISVLEFLNQFDHLHCQGCEGKVVKNGTITDEGVQQQILLCRKCGSEWRYPLLNKRLQGKQTNIFNFGSQVTSDCGVPSKQTEQGKKSETENTRKKLDDGRNRSLLDFRQKLEGGHL